MANSYMLPSQDDMTVFIHIHQVFKSTNMSSGGKERKERDLKL